MRTPEEIIERVEGLVTQVFAWDLLDWSGWSQQEKEDVGVLVLYTMQQRNRRRRKGQRVASRLLRSWLPPEQATELRRRRAFTVHGSAGGRYRIYPNTGMTNRIERHGKRDFAVAGYCLHPDEELPPADIALAHYLLLQTDEPAFLEAANERAFRLWDGEWLRRLRQIRTLRTENPHA